MSHVCQDCIAQEVMHSLEMTANGQCHLCGEDSILNHQDATEGCTIRHHCYHGVERLMASELVKTEVQTGIMSFIVASSVISIVPAEYRTEKSFIAHCEKNKDGRFLTTLYCQFLA